MELTKKAEALKQDLSLSKLADLVVDICKVIEDKEVLKADKEYVKDFVYKEKLKKEIKKK